SCRPCARSASGTSRRSGRPCCWPWRSAPCCGRVAGRSEEHTSELQSQSNLVCRLLLEKKKKKKKINIPLTIKDTKKINTIQTAGISDSADIARQSWSTNFVEDIHEIVCSAIRRLHNTT